MKSSSRNNLSIGLPLAAILAVTLLGSGAQAGVKQIAYPEVKVTVETAFKPDPAFQKMQAAFADAAVKKDVQALAALVAPMFLWTVGGQPADELDLGRDAIHNFKVVFGFRALGKDVDGGVDDGPYWDALAIFARDQSYYAATDSGNLVCGPISAAVTDQDVFDQAREKIETGDEGAEWYFTLANTNVAKAPGDTGAPIAKIGTIALPMLDSFPPAKNGQPASQPTQIEVLLPSGKSGWVPASAVRPMETDRLCYARTQAGDWRIAAVDQTEQ